MENERSQYGVLSAKATISQILSGRSVCRFGDGELDMIFSKDYGETFTSGFQTYDLSLAERLSSILLARDSKCLICLPACMFGFGIDHFVKRTQRFWIYYTLKNFNKITHYINKNIVYGETNFSRFYLSHRDKSDCPNSINLIRSIWSDRSVVIVEGSQTRMGVNNDLFSNVKTVKRIICPSVNAWGAYDKILKAVLHFSEKDDLIVIALGMTATVLAYDLSEKGFQAVDIGHVDIEYEWMLRKATKKMAIPNKFTNEAVDGAVFTEYKDQLYQSQILETII